MKGFLAESEQSERENVQRNIEEEAQLLDIGVVPIKSEIPLDFEPPPGVEARWISRDSGQRMKEGAPGAVKEYFIKESTSSIEEGDVEEMATPIEEYFESGRL
jgi:hypothetical protein